MTYIGDGVYAEIERGMIKLTTERLQLDMSTSDDVIYLDPQVYLNLFKFAEKAGFNPALVLKPE